MELKGKKINFLGDSITEGIGASSPDRSFVSLMKEACGLAEARNYGKGGTRIARQSVLSDSPYDVDFNMRAPEMEDDADIVVVFGGTNDFNHGQAPLGTPDDRDVYTFYGALHTLILTLIKKYLGKTIVFITPLHRFNDYSQYGQWKPDGVEKHPLVDYVRAIREVSEYYSVPVLDLFAAGNMPGNVPEWYREFMPDGLHPNDKGYALICEKLKAFLERL